MIQIGETFKYDGKSFIVREETSDDDGCNGCFFDENDQYDCNNVMSHNIQCCKHRPFPVIFVFYDFKFGKCYK